MNTSQNRQTLSDSIRYLSPDAFLQEHPRTMGRTLFFEAIRRGEIPHIRVGRRILVPHNALDLMLEAQRRDSDA
jgi:hypothetical protein